MGKIFNKGLHKDDKKEGVFKRLENTKDKNEEQLQAIKDQGEKQLKELKNIDKNKTLKAIDKISKKMMKQINYCLNLIKSIKHLIKQNLLVQKLMELNRFLFPLKLIKKIHNYEITLNEAINNQTELRILINNLDNDYNPKSSKKVKEKNRFLESARKLSDARDGIIDFFEKGRFPFKGNVFKTKEEESKENKLEKI